jgi:hypothetical protein
MSTVAKIGIVVALLAFAAGVVWFSIPRSPAICEVCLNFNGEMVCRRGAGNTAEEAAQAAQESTCGGNVSGMTELINCRNAPPAQSRCWQRGEEPPPFSPVNPRPDVPQSPAEVGAS